MLGARALIYSWGPPEMGEPSVLSKALRACKRSSIVLFYEPLRLARLPRAPEGLEIMRLPSNDPRALEVASRVQQSSWGFYKPPREDSLVIVGLMGGEPVASAYFHRASKNIDYGVHVVRSLWRRGVGSRILSEVARVAGGEFSVVRVLRGRPLSSMDRRALGFYLSRGPSRVLLVCEPLCGGVSSG